jgi:nitrite reductase/ring-hydroxylating ferredoxin subunit
VPLRRISVQNRDIALSFRNGAFGALSNACNHVGGPLGEGRLDGDYVTCPRLRGDWPACGVQAAASGDQGAS